MTGRPKAETPRDKTVAVRLSHGELLAIAKAANKDNRAISAWIRLRVLDALKGLV